jgi:hypothetical protein
MMLLTKIYLSPDLRANTGTKRVIEGMIHLG